VGTRHSDIWKATSHAVLGKPELRATDVRALAGAAADNARRLWQALGFPAVQDNEPVFTRRDVEALGFANALIEGDGPDRGLLLSMARATGQALSRVANMHVLPIAGAVEEAARSATLSNSEAADRIAELAESVVRGHEPFLGYIYRRHLLVAISQIVAGATDDTTAAEGTPIGFADLVDFTETSQQLSEDELARVVDRFEQIAYQEIPDRGGRVVKTLGDEVMFTNPSPRAMAETALALALGCKADELLADVRVGLALGPMLAWEGDLYGPTVNLAHRLVGVARPGTVIVSDSFADCLAGDESFALVEIRDVKLKGIGRTKPWVLRWKDAE